MTTEEIIAELRRRIATAKSERSQATSIAKQTDLSGQIYALSLFLSWIEAKERWMGQLGQPVGERTQ